MITTLNRDRRILTRRGEAVCFVTSLVLSFLSTSLAFSYNEVVIAGGSMKTMGLNIRYSVATNPLTGYPSIASVRTTRTGIQLASFNGTSWEYEVVMDSTATVTGISLAFDPTSGEPRIAYCCDSTNPGVHIAFRSGSTWTTESFDTSTSIQKLFLLIPPSGGPLSVAYSAGASTPYVRFAERTGPNAYSVQNVEQDSSVIIGEHISAAVNPDTGEIGIAYTYYPSSAPVAPSVNYAHKSPGGAWSIETAFTGDSYCYLTFADHGAGRVPQIAFQASPPVVYYQNGSAWDSETLSTSSLYDFETDPSTGRGVVLALQSSTLWLIRYTGSGWASESVGPAPNVLNDAYRLTLSPTGVATVTAFDVLDTTYTNGSLTAYRNPTGTFNSEVVIDLQSPGWYPSVYLGRGPGNVWAAYQEGIRRRLCLSHWTGSEFVQQTIDSSSLAGSYTNLVWPSGSAQPWIVYGRQAGPAAAVFNGTGYTIEPISSTGSHTVARLDPVTSEVCVAMNGTGGVYFGRRTGPGTWNVETIPVGVTNPNGDLTMDFDSDDHPHVLFTQLYYNNARPLYDASFDGSTWSVTPIDATGNSEYASQEQAAVDPVSGDLMVAYVYSGNGLFQIRLNRYNGGSWGTPESAVTLDPNVSGSRFPRLIPDKVSGNPTLFYSCPTSTGRVLRIAEKKGGLWSNSLFSDSLGLDFSHDGYLDGTESSTGAKCFVAFDTTNQRLVGWFETDLYTLGAGPAWSLYK